MKLPERLVEIEEYAFEGCDRLATLTISEKNSLMNLCRGAFSGTAITELTLPGKLAVLRDGAFAGMTALKKLTFAGADFIGNYILEGTSLTTIYYTDTVESFEALMKTENWYRNTVGDVTAVVCSNGTLTVSDAE
jgi:hypothetical protein